MTLLCSLILRAPDKELVQYNSRYSAVQSIQEEGGSRVAMDE